jgi:protein TonB
MIKKRPVPIGDTDFVDINKNYPEAAKLNSIEGKVKVKILVDAQGKATRRQLVTKLGYGLDALAMRLAKKLRFEPALDTNDKAVPATVVWTFQFTLPK